MEMKKEELNKFKTYVTYDEGYRIVYYYEKYHEAPEGLYAKKIEDFMTFFCENDVVPEFKSFDDVVLDYNQRKRRFETNNAEWKSKLESCNGIYLILDKKCGKQYVGSTYNRDGIWGRWKQYAETGHGGDKDLKPLLADDSNYAAKYFQWCILETLPLKILDEHAIDRESLYKRKFGTREFGYNNN